MWATEGEDFGQYFSNQFTEAYEELDDAGWTTEYAWGGGGCDPCPGDPPDGDDLASLGMDEEYIHYGEYFFTRLHMRYTPQQVAEHGEVNLYPTNLTEQKQYRYIEYKWALEDIFPVCGVGMVENPGSCESDPTDQDPQSNPDDSIDIITENGCGGGCDGSGGAALGLWFLGAGLLRRRIK